MDTATDIEGTVSGIYRTPTGKDPTGLAVLDEEIRIRIVGGGTDARGSQNGRRSKHSAKILVFGEFLPISSPGKTLKIPGTDGRTPDRTESPRGTDTESPGECRRAL